MEEEDKKKEIWDIVREYMRTQSDFTEIQLADTPTDNLSVANRKYVNLYGTTASRPIASIAHLAQRYFDTTIGRPVYFNPNSSVWTDGAGSVS